MLLLSSLPSCSFSSNLQLIGPFFPPPPPDLKGLVFAKLLLSDSLLLEEFSVWSQEAGSLFIPQDQVLGGQLIFSPLCSLDFIADLLTESEVRYSLMGPGGITVLPF